MTPERRHSLVRGFAVIEGAQPAEQTSECDTPAELKTLPSIWFANEYRRSNARVRVGHQHAGPPARGDRTAPTPYCRCCCSPTSRQPRDGFLVYSPTCAVIRGLSCTRSIGHRRGSPSAAPTDMPCAARPSRRRGRHGGPRSPDAAAVRSSTLHYLVRLDQPVVQGLSRTANGPSSTRAGAPVSGGARSTDCDTRTAGS
jgi:hypothetical protein